MTDEDLMRLAIQKAQEGIALGQSPFASAIVKNGQVLAIAHNTVWRDGDPTAHAEINCIRAATKELGAVFLSGCTLFSTTEPCPMCLAACHWARIERVIFGATIADAAAAGFSELSIDAERLARLGNSTLVVRGGVLQKECADLFQQWLKSGKARPY